MNIRWGAGLAALACWIGPAQAASKPGHAAPAPAVPAALEGQVKDVIDGATFVLQPAAGGNAVTVRLVGVVPPEPCQTWGRESRDALRDYLSGQPLQLRGTGHDKQGRLLATVFAAGADVGKMMVSEGHAFSARGRSDHGPYVKQERVAHSLSRGMYSTGAKVLRPDDFLRDHGPCAPQATH